MSFYFALMAVILLAPFFVSGRSTLAAAQERGLGRDIAVWLGVATLTTPVILIGMWIGGLFR